MQRPERNPRDQLPQVRLGRAPAQVQGTKGV